ncbi:7-cyano-7-deazaguanine synthase [Acinetobacter indicus]|uniref:7-cyano-7-deazaguanine synthase n=1 Tax=Acinetobacter indicus TaxID=756892 RepID=UPI001443B7E1|nr:7-cyano-7-deazaguanine synthase [Acinetobacter indicus]
MSIIIHFDRYKWEKIGKTNCFEKIFNGKIWNQELIDGLDVISKESFIDLVKQLDGFFSLVFKSERKLFVAVDHIRSYPIFYSEYNNNFYLSDNAEWVREQVKDEIMDPVAQQEFQLLGYVTQANTLYPNVKQLQAGELLTYDIEKGLNLYQHYEFTHKEPPKFDIPEQLDKLDIVARTSMQKLVDFANGRQIVVPLSGGYDSRLIILLLKEAGYKNVVAFSYGEKTNKEVIYSKKIADSLNIKWHFVEYNKDQFKDFWKTEELRLYQKFGSNWVSLPHIQDLIAIKSLKKLKKVENNAVFSPGHCCVTGYLPNLDNKIIDRQLLISELNKVHSLISLPNNSSILEKVYAPNDSKDLDINTFVSEFMRYGWSERQTKFICNSVRAYEYYDFSWYLPLWDKSFSIYWCSISLNQRLERKLYIDYIKNIQSIYLKEEFGNAADLSLPFRLIKKVVSHSSFIYSLFRKIYHLMAKSNSNLSASKFRYPIEEYKELVNKGYSKNGIACYFFLKEFSNEKD